MGLGVDSHYAATIAYDRKGYWFNAGNKAVNWALNKERLINWGYYDLATFMRSIVFTILPHLLREVSFRSLSLAFFHDLACTRM